MVDLAAKKEEINLVLSEPDVDLWKLRELCLTEGGLCDDTIRKRAWPKLVGLHGSESLERRGVESPPRRSGRSRIPRPDPPPDVVDNSIISQLDGTEQSAPRPSKSDRIAECLDADQIDRDVARCTWHLLNGSQRSRRLQMENKHRKKVASLLKRKQTRLSNFINLTLVQANSELDEDNQLRYYQGFHDVACIFLSSLGGGGSGPIPSNASSLETLAASMGLDLPSRVLGQVAKNHFRDAMRNNFLQLQVALRLVLFPLLARFDPEVHAHLYYCDMEPFFALSWVITWFSHDIRDTALVKRLFDAFIVSHPLFPLYLSAAMILHPVNRMEILSTDCDFASVHQTLACLPKNSCMVGWKYKVTDGYVSNDGGDEGSTASTDMDSTYLDELDDGSEAHSLISSNLSMVGSNQARVPFQELIDMALSYMRRVPPRKLMVLAKRYFAEDPNRAFLLEQSKSISLLQPPPSWGLAATTPADWVLKQRLRQNRGMKATNRRDRRSSSRSRTRAEGREAERDVNGREEIEKYLDEKQKTLAVIASGFGPGDDEEERRRKRRKLLMWGAVAVALVAVSYAVVTHTSPSVGPTVGSQGEGSMEREVLVTKERPVKSILNHSETRKQSNGAAKRDVVESRTQLPSSGKPAPLPRSEETAPLPKSEKPTQPSLERNRSREESSVSSRDLVEPAQQKEPVQKVNARTSTSSVAQSTGLNTNVSPKATVARTALVSEDATKGTTNVTVPPPVRFFKGIIRQTRQLANDYHKFPGALWAQGVYDDVRLAFEERDPNLLPGAGMFYDLVSSTRQVLEGSERECPAQGTANDAGGHAVTSNDAGGHAVTSEKRKPLLQKVFKNVGRLSQVVFRKARYFLTAEEGRGARLAKAVLGTARAALAENEAEVVVL